MGLPFAGEDPMALVLTSLSGVAWTIVYIEAIRIGFKQQTYAMPIAALSLNIAWESIYSLHDLATAPGLQGYINLVWAFADIVVLYTFFRYGRAELPTFVTGPVFIAWGMTMLGASVAIQLLFIGEFGMGHARRSILGVPAEPVDVGALYRHVRRPSRRARTVAHHRRREVDRHHGSHVGVRWDPRLAIYPRHRNPVQRLRPRVHRAASLGPHQSTAARCLAGARRL
jgi:hypothetical protein